MNQRIKFFLIGLMSWFILFMGWLWWKSHPLVRWEPPLSPQSQQEKIDSILNQSLLSYRIPGIVLGVVENEKLTILQSVGFADLESKDSLTSTTPFPVASISKLVTALTASAYFQEAGISLDSRILEVLTLGKNQQAADWEVITIRDLIDHTSGLKDLRNWRQLLVKTELKDLSQLPSQLTKPDPSLPKPHYADLNYDLLGYILQSHSRKPFSELVQQYVLNPAGMTSSGFNSSLDPMEHTSLRGYQPTFLWKRLEEKKTKFERYPSPSSGLVTTGEDLANAMIHLSRWEVGFLYPYLELLAGSKAKPSGFQELELAGHSFLGHFGEQGAYNGLFFFSKELDKGIFVLTNGRDLEDHRVKITEAVISILISKP